MRAGCRSRGAPRANSRICPQGRADFLHGGRRRSDPCGRCIFICVGTPPKIPRGPTFPPLTRCAANRGGGASPKLVIEKSTVPARTGLRAQPGSFRILPGQRREFRVASIRNFSGKAPPSGDFSTRPHRRWRGGSVVSGGTEGNLPAHSGEDFPGVRCTMEPVPPGNKAEFWLHHQPARAD